jgi:hypothetical protein
MIAPWKEWGGGVKPFVREGGVDAPPLGFTSSADRPSTSPLYESQLR